MPERTTSIRGLQWNILERVDGSPGARFVAFGCLTRSLILKEARQNRGMPMTDIEIAIIAYFFSLLEMK